MFRKIKKRIRKRGMLMFEAVLMLATLTAVTFGMVTIMTGSFSNLAAAKDAGEAQQMGDLVVSLVKQKDYDKMDELISYAPASKPTSMDNFVGDSDLKGKYSFSVEQIGDEIDAGSLGSTDDSDSTDDEGAKVKIMKVAIHPQDNKNVELYSTQVPVMSTKSGNDSDEQIKIVRYARIETSFDYQTHAPEGEFLYMYPPIVKWVTAIYDPIVGFTELGSVEVFRCSGDIGREKDFEHTKEPLRRWIAEHRQEAENGFKMVTGENFSDWDGIDKAH